MNHFDFYENERGVGVEAIIWDFGGVFTTSPFEAFNRYEERRGLPRDFIRKVNAANHESNAWARLECSEISAADFDRLYLEESSALGHPVRGAKVLALLSGEIRPRMVAALRTCKQHFKVGCITNNVIHDNGSSMAADRTGASRASEIMQLFDAIIESSKAGVRKPNPRMYQMMCELLGVDPHACVYLDDLGVNCKPAAQLGMTAIKVVTEDQALADLAAVTQLRFTWSHS